MKYMTTNLRLPEDLWKGLKSEAANQKRRFTDLVREYLSTALARQKGRSLKRAKSLYGVLKKADIPEEFFKQAKTSVITSLKDFS